MSKINKKMSVNIQGILDLRNGVIKLEVEDIDEPVVFSELIKEFDGKSVKISLSYGEDLWRKVSNKYEKGKEGNRYRVL